MSNNTKTETQKKEPIICSKFYPIEMIIPEPQQQEVQPKTSKSKNNLITAIILIGIALYILWQGGLFQ